MKKRLSILLMLLAVVTLAMGQKRRRAADNSPARQEVVKQSQQQPVEQQSQQQPVEQQVAANNATVSLVGDAATLYKKGVAYENGDGVEKNRVIAAQYFKKAAELGLDSAQYSLGKLYDDGYGVERDYSQAAYWYRKAAEQGHTLAMSNLGFLYQNGRGVAQDEKQAVEWYRKGMKKNGTSAIHRLGICYYEGTGVERNYEEAKRLFERVLAKKKDHRAAKIMLSRTNKKIEEQKLLAASSVSVDKGIPVAERYDMNSFAVIIGNENYESDDVVAYAENDAKIFREYVQRTLGVPEKHINYIKDAGLNKIRGAVRWLAKAMEVTGGQGKAIFYYAGQGIPDEATKTGYLLPVDGLSNDLESAYPLSRLYQELNNIPAQQITVFLDACFNGAKRDGDMLTSARGIAIKVKPSAPTGKMVVFSAAQDAETAFVYQKEQHGMFTYDLLKKLQESKGEVTLGELQEYLTAEVKRQSFAERNKVQTPAVIPSQALAESWQQIRLK